MANAAMPGLAKIGITVQRELTSRLNQLYTAEVPLPFDRGYA